jgi:hypothetical protein
MWSRDSSQKRKFLTQPLPLSLPRIFNAKVRISAIKPIFAIFWDFDGVGQEIPTKAYFRKVWI